MGARGEGGWVAFSTSWQAAGTEGPFRGFPAASSSLGTGEVEKGRGEPEAFICISVKSLRPS